MFDTLLDSQFIINIVVTIILAGLAIIIGKRVKFPEITFIPDQFIFLVDNLLSEYDDIGILYKEKPVDKNISFIKGTFINSGKDDIDLKNAEKNLKIIFPKGTNIIKVEITSKSDDLEVDVINSSENKIEFNAKLFKRKEFFTIESIISFPINMNLGKIDSNNINTLVDFDLRIDKFDKVKLFDFNKDNRINRDRIYEGFSYIFLILYIFINYFFFNPKDFLPITRNFTELTYLISDIDTKDSVLVRISPHQMDSLKIYGINKEYNKIVSLDDFYSNPTWKPKITNITEDKYTSFKLDFKKYGMYLVLIFLAITIYRDSYNKNKRKRLQKIINNNRNSYDTK